MTNRIDDPVSMVTSDGVHPFLINAFARLEELNGYETEGIFRVEGNSRRLKDSVEVFRGVEPIPDGWNVYDVCTMIKRYFRRIEPPIFNDCQPTLIKLAGSLKENRTTFLSAIFAVLERLPPSHVATLGYLMRHLKKISTYSQRNKMTVENLAIVFALALFRDEQVVTAAYQTPGWKGRRSEVSLLSITRVRTECQIAIVRQLIKNANLIGSPKRSSNGAPRLSSRPLLPVQSSDDTPKLSSRPSQVQPPNDVPPFSNRPSVAAFLAGNKGFVEMKRQFFDKR